ncbi:MAG: hypothetical protein EOR78_14790 [Mesorhizobium sp.]|nr:MAG: hypothetical protein EOQ33_30245 [Mesorhizobium sp.]RWK60030.1 MAG: hypothetical protein EOR49_23035 [Mesorhizobium sp.]RWM44752.1 MAG: hypothetical protein EOR76_23235 [Mesorhizobium sp.]RWM54322.1 MAG: hypothetical protein EOR79_24650 [Mesorhizobium sp.]RWM55735.1 MAG: hypothetical protein EOR78_14790 [Mesorhizobium sp.]
MTNSDQRRYVEGGLFLAGFAACIPLANYFIGHVGTECLPSGPCVIPVAPGLTAPSGVLFVGLALVLRDLVQRRLGLWWAVAAIVAGAALSTTFAPPALVVASVAAFLLSETADLLVFTPLQRRGLIRAVVASSVVGLVVDSVVFLTLAFGSLQFLPGQIVGKTLMVLISVPVLACLRARDRQLGLQPPWETTAGEETEISAWCAIWHALTRRSIAYFPRVQQADGSWTTVGDAELIQKATTALTDLAPNSDDLDGLLSRARESLDEVKALTDYQDGKATRLLTIITFLSAMSGLLFGKLVDLYPLQSLLAKPEVPWWHLALVCVAYLGFAAFALSSICGAMVTFHAIRARFRYPKTSRGGRAKSFLFYTGILGVLPDEWASSFVATDDRTKLAGNVKLRYFQNYVVESYLIAAKVADKVRYLVPAQAILAIATRVLLFWLLAYATTFALVPPLDKTATPILTPTPEKSGQTQ